MKPGIVVDIGNTRMKWGRCSEDRVTESVSLPLDHPAAWEGQVKRWNLENSLSWAIAGVHPERGIQFTAWVEQRGDPVTVLEYWKGFPIKIAVQEADRVGIDRVLNAVAAKSRVQREISIFIVDAGSAVTVDWVDEKGTFRGGSIFPGIQLMAKALHEYTAALPLLTIKAVPSLANPILPGTSTVTAMEAGIFWAVAGGIKALLRQLISRAKASRHCVIFLTGGDAHYLAGVMDPTVQIWPEMTLEGIRLAAEVLP
jgi:type III pantothenate kinase